MLDTLTGLPAALSTGAIASTVSMLLAMFAPAVASIPGFRDTDATRNSLMRALIFALTLGGLVGLAWTQNIVLTQAEIPALLAFAAGGTLGTHVLYTNIKNSGTSAAPVAPAPTAPKPPAVPPLPSQPVPSGSAL